MPLDPDVRLDNPDCFDKRLDETETKDYQSIVGSLMYAALGSRPDIAHAVAILSRYASNPLEMHITAAKRVLRYLSRTRGHGIKFDGPGNFHGNLTLYTDADWAGCRITRKSMNGCVAFLNGPVSWIAKAQSVVALCTLESEYIASSEAVREAVWLRLLLESIDTATDGTCSCLDTSSPTKVFIDNQGALSAIKSGIIKSKTRHIEVKFHYVHDNNATKERLNSSTWLVQTTTRTS